MDSSGMIRMAAALASLRPSVNDWVGRLLRLIFSRVA